MTLIDRGREFGAWIRNRASAADVARADSPGIRVYTVA